MIIMSSYILASEPYKLAAAYGGEGMNQKGDVPMAVQRSIRLDADVYEWLSRLAKEDRRSIADIIRMILDDAKQNDWRP